MLIDEEISVISFKINYFYTEYKVVSFLKKFSAV